MYSMQKLKFPCLPVSIYGTILDFLKMPFKNLYLSIYRHLSNLGH